VKKTKNRTKASRAMGVKFSEGKLAAGVNLYHT